MTKRMVKYTESKKEKTMKIIKKVLVDILLFGGKLLNGKRIPVLLYHRITSDTRDDRLSFTTVDQFIEQMQYLKRKKYKCLKTDEFLDYAVKKNSLPRKTFLLTFDDGFNDNFDAVKIANSYGFSAIIFVSTDFIGKTYEHIPYKGNVDLGYIEKKVAEPIPFSYLDSNQIRELSKNGNEIYPHTCRHICLSFEDIATQVSEIKISCKILEEITGAKCNSFSYPYGIYTNESIDYLKRSGFKCAFSVDAGTNNIKNVDLYMIKRHNIGNLPSLKYFKLELTNAFSIYKRISKIYKSHI